MNVKDNSKRLGEAMEHHRAGRLAQAEAIYREILQQEPATADAWYLLGALTEQAGQADLALEYVDRAIALNPDNGQFHYSRGLALQKLARPQQAAAAYQRSLAIIPEHIASLENLAVALADIGDDKQGEEICRKVLALAPGSLIAHRNLGTLLINRGGRAAALEHFEFVLENNPADASAHAKRAQVLLALGRFEEAYASHAWRQHSPDFSDPTSPKLLALPSLGGRDIDKRKLVILPEHGVGDEILFAAGLPAVSQRASRVVLFADPRLVALLQRSFPGIDVRSGMSVNYCDWPAGISSDWLRCEAGDLPEIAFGNNYPQPQAYLRADPDRVDHWRQHLKALPGKKTIGIAWRGGADARARQARSLSLQDFIPLLEMRDTSFVNLQYAAPGHDLVAEIDNFNAARQGRAKIVQLDKLDTMNDLDELAALSLALDCVVTIDSAIAHLAAATGAKTCVLLPPGGDWRWFEQRDDSPFYTNARVWRRQTDKDWSESIAGIVGWLHQAQDADAKASTSASVAVNTRPDDSTPVTQHSPRAQKILLLNDTSAWYHWGCSCTSIALQEGLRSTAAHVNSCALLRELGADVLPSSVDAFDSAVVFKRFRRRFQWLVEKIKEADRIVINGEGTLHGSGPQALGLLYLAWLAMERFDRPVQILNHSVYPLDGINSVDDMTVALYRKVYERLDKIVVREPASQQVTQALGFTATLGFDCLPLFAANHGPKRRDINARDKRVIIAGSVALNQQRIAMLATQIDALHADGYSISVLLGARGFPALDDAHFVAALNAATAAKLDVVLARSEYEWLSHIGDASLQISGRFHHSIAAACMRTPFVVLSSNTPKITGLMQVLSQLSTNADGFQVIDDDQELLAAAVQARLSSSADFVLDEASLRQLGELARENF